VFVPGCTVLKCHVEIYIFLRYLVSKEPKVQSVFVSNLRNTSRTRLKRHRFVRHLAYNVRYSVVSTNLSVLIITFHSSVITTLVLITQHILSFYDVITEFDRNYKGMERSRCWEYFIRERCLLYFGWSDVNPASYVFQTFHCLQFFVNLKVSFYIILERLGTVLISLYRRS
jgi:hypothetical protein